MLDFIFTIDYEIYGNGEGSLKDLIFDPTQQLKKIFDRAGAKLVFFVEAAELEIIEEAGSDPAIDDVKHQIKHLYEEGHEIALHLHSQWYTGIYKNSKWILNDSEYNLCTLPEKRITEIVDQAIRYLRLLLSDPVYTPLSFRAGNWLFQPTQPAAGILYSRGIKIDSSVFKGGLQHQTKLDYRRALKNGYFWNFHDDVNISSATRKMTEIPIYSEMVQPWRMATKKRLSIQHKTSSGGRLSGQQINRLLDLLRFRHPLKLDFCRMTLDELTTMMDRIIKNDQNTPEIYKPIVAIGHSKDLVDVQTVELFLDYLKRKDIKVTLFQETYGKLADNHY